MFSGYIGLVLVLDITGCRAAKSSPHLLGARCISQAARRHSRRRVRPTGVGGVCCAVARRRVCKGALPGKAGLPGVVAVHGRSLSRFFALCVPALPPGHCRAPSVVAYKSRLRGV